MKPSLANSYRINPAVLDMKKFSDTILCTVLNYGTAQSSLVNYSLSLWELNKFFFFFHRAALNGHFEVIRVLAAYGADLGKVALDGNTSLHYAAQQGFGPICKFLAQRGQLVYIIAIAVCYLL